MDEKNILVKFLKNYKKSMKWLEDNINKDFRKLPEDFVRNYFPKGCEFYQNGGLIFTGKWWQL